MKVPSDNVRYRQPSIDPTRRERRYLEVLWYLQQRHEPVLAVHLVRWLQAPAPTVSQVLRVLERKAYIQRNGRGDITLTSSGVQQARQIVYRHRLLECLLFEVLQIPWHLLHREALELEPVMSDALEQRVRQRLVTATYSPYGVPLAVDNQPVGMCLRSVATGQRFVVGWIDAEGEEDAELLRELATVALLPGAQLEVLESSPLRGVRLRHRQHECHLDAVRTGWVWGTEVSG